MRDECQSIARLEKIMHTQASSSSASASIPLNTYSSASQAVLWSYLCTLVFRSKLGVASPSWPRGWWTLSNSICMHTNSGRHFICPLSHNITIRVNLSIESVSRPYKRNLQSHLWRASFKGAGRKRICQALKSRGSLSCSGSVYQLQNASQRVSWTTSRHITWSCGLMRNLQKQETRQ